MLGYPPQLEYLALPFEQITPDFYSAWWKKTSSEKIEDIVKRVAGLTRECDTMDFSHLTLLIKQAQLRDIGRLLKAFLEGVIPCAAHVAALRDTTILEPCVPSVIEFITPAPWQLEEYRLLLNNFSGAIFNDSFDWLEVLPQALEQLKRLQGEFGVAPVVISPAGGAGAGAGAGAAAGSGSPY